MSGKKKTNAVRIIESFDVYYTLHEYDVDESDLSGETVARKIGADPDSVFKTLVARGASGSIYVFCIPVTTELQLKLAAGLSEEKSIELVKISELLELTGYIRGGCSPIGMKKHFTTFIDDSIFLFDEIYCSAGARGVQVKLRVDDLIKISGAKTGSLI